MSAPATPTLKAARGRPAIHQLAGAVFTPPPGAAPPPTDAQGEIDDDALLDAEVAALLVEAGGAELEIPLISANEPANDDPLARFDAGELPPVRFADVGGEPMSMARFHAEIVEGAADTISMLARHRSERIMAHRSGQEVRILQQTEAILATGAGCISEVTAWWSRSMESIDPWKSWAPVFVLASIEGVESLRAIVHGIEQLAPTDHLAGIAAAEALAVVPHPERARLAAVLLASRHPIARAVGVDVRSRLDTLSPDEIAYLIQDAEPAVVASAIRAAERLASAPPALLPLIEARVLHPSPNVAWRAARYLAISGRRDAYFLVRDRDALAAILGPRALELFVLAGRAEDIVRMEELLSRFPITPPVLSAIGRFGNAASWSFLLHFLADDDLCNAAVSALEVLFGAMVPPPESRRAAAWKSAIASARLDPRMRYRRGLPWSVDTVVTELVSGDLVRGEAEARVDELATRGRTVGAVDLCLWSPDADAQVQALAVAASKGLKGRNVGGWE